MAMNDGFPAADNPQPEILPPNPEQPEPKSSSQPFPWKRLIFAVLFGFIGWFTLMVGFGLAVLQFIVVAVNRAPNEDLKTLTANLGQYLREIISYISFAQDEKPFPFSAFPSVK
ncbi:MAG: DUF4389 domain-containing protein [Alphaproteobacteria bacterium]|nr:DUF4389 domain-containing protein [Alphaproteobacteria bacterium]